jgi:hypothetical protein
MFGVEPSKFGIQFFFCPLSSDFNFLISLDIGRSALGVRRFLTLTSDFSRLFAYHLSLITLLPLSARRFLSLPSG